jgi:hypothetical protein
LGFDDAVKRDLAAEKIDEDDNAGPYLFGFESNLNEILSTLEVGCSISGITAMAGFSKYNSLVPYSDFTMYDINLKL